MVEKMFAYVFTFLFVHITLCNSIITSELNEKRNGQLIISFVVHRHGDRTPDPDEIILADDPKLIERLSYPYGTTGLTSVGKSRAYKLGAYLHDMYANRPNGDNLITDLDIQNAAFLRSTDLPRTKMSLLCVLASLFPPQREQKWSDGLGQIWQPVAFDAVPSPKDYLRFTANCQRYKSLLSLASSKSANEFTIYNDLAIELYNRTGYNFTEKPLLYASLHDLFKSQAAIGIPVPKWAVPLEPKINEAAKRAYDLFMENDEMKSIATGVVLNDFLNKASDFISGKQTSQRLHIYTSHDYNVGALMSVSNVKLETIPDYCSMFALELYQNVTSGDYYVLPVYLPKPGESNITVLKVNNCKGGICNFNEFRTNVQKYAINATEYNQICDIK